MKKFGVQVVVLLTIIIVGLVSFYSNNSLIGKLNPANETQSLVIKDKTIKVEVADTQDKRGRGLSGRASLDPNSGMLFIFSSPGKYQFWMKEMIIPLDFIFIRDGRVVDFIRNVPPPDPGTSEQDLKIYQSVEDFDNMLEVNSGFVDQNHIDIGSMVSLVKK